jgi:hypothetical protein
VAANAVALTCETLAPLCGLARKRDPGDLAHRRPSSSSSVPCPASGLRFSPRGSRTSDPTLEGIGSAVREGGWQRQLRPSHPPSNAIYQAMGCARVCRSSRAQIRYRRTGAGIEGRESRNHPPLRGTFRGLRGVVRPSQGGRPPSLDAARKKLNARQSPSAQSPAPTGHHQWAQMLWARPRSVPGQAPAPPCRPFTSQGTRKTHTSRGGGPGHE